MLVGHSGVGKSTLVNALVPDAGRSVGVVNDVTGRGRHTSTSAVALRLPPARVRGDGDREGDVSSDEAACPAAGSSTPRACGPSASRTCEVDGLLAPFADLAEVAAECPRGCTHADDAPDCALDEWVDGGRPGRRDAGRPVGAPGVLPAAAGQPDRHDELDRRGGRPRDPLTHRSGVAPPRATAAVPARLTRSGHVPRIR